MPFGGLPFFGKDLLNQGFDKETVLLIMSAWRDSTKKLYSTYLNKWSTFCIERSIQILSPTLPQACRVLRLLASQGLGYGAVNSARCALSTILPNFGYASFGSHPYVRWLLKGVYERNPPKPRYTEFWNVNKVLEMFKCWGPNKALDIKKLTFKLVMLLLLVTSQRGQTIINLDIQDMELSDKVVFKMKTLLKHNRVGDPLDSLILRSFHDCKRLCVVRCLKCYLNKTQYVRSYSKLILSFMRLFKPISRDTLARWTVKVMEMAGLDISKYRSHSTRGAATSAAKRLGVPLNIIMRQASWRSSSSFAKFYDNKLEDDVTEVGTALLADAL